MDARMTAIETGQRSIIDLLTKLTTGAGLPAGNPAAGIPPQAAAAAAAPGTYFCCVFPFFLNVSHHSTFSHLIANVLCMTEALMPTHRLPSFSPTMPKSFGLLLREWISRLEVPYKVHPSIRPTYCLWPLPCFLPVRLEAIL
jgi:hypothetical protein